MFIYFARLFQILQHISKCRSKGKLLKFYSVVDIELPSFFFTFALNVARALHI